MMHTFLNTNLPPPVPSVLMKSLQQPRLSGAGPGNTLHARDAIILYLARLVQSDVRSAATLTSNPDYISEKPSRSFAGVWLRSSYLVKVQGVPVTAPLPADVDPELSKAPSPSSVSV